MTRTGEYRLTFFRRTSNGWWPAFNGQWYPGQLVDNGHGYNDPFKFVTGHKVEDGTYLVIQMEWYDTHGSGQPRSFFFDRYTEPAKGHFRERTMSEAAFA